MIVLQIEKTKRNRLLIKKEKREKEKHVETKKHKKIIMIEKTSNKNINKKNILHEKETNLST